jgi:hypothetical protein
LFLLGVDLTYLGLTGSAPPLFTAEWGAFLIGGVPATWFSALAHLWPPLLATGWAVLVLLRQRSAKQSRRKDVHK